MPMFLHNVCPLLHITCSPQCLCTASNPHLRSAELHALPSCVAVIFRADLAPAKLLPRRTNETQSVLYLFK